MSANKQVELNSKELKEFLIHIVNNNRYLQDNGKRPVSVNIEGDAGLGKTSVILQLAQELDMNFVKLNLSQIEELGDLVGFPVRQFQLCKEGVITTKPTEVVKVPKVVSKVEKYMDTEYRIEIKKKQVLRGGRMIMEDVESRVPYQVEKERTVQVEGFEEQVVPGQSTNTGECIWVDEQAVTEYTTQGYRFTGEKRMTYCPPEWIANMTKGGILLIDDWTRADLRFTQACMELIDRGEYISWKLPKDWFIILTSNPDNGEYLVNSIDVAQRTRFISVNMKWDPDTWGTWAEKEGIDSRCINFVLLHPETISARVNPRSVTTFFNCISSLESFAESLPLIQMVGEGSVGPEFALMFTQFINNKLDKIIHPKIILTHESESYIVGELHKLLGRPKEKGYRADIASVMVTRLVNYSLLHAESNPISDDVANRLIRIMTDESLFTNDLQYTLIKKILNGNKQKFQKLLTNAEVVKMSTK